MLKLLVQPIQQIITTKVSKLQYRCCINIFNIYRRYIKYIWNRFLYKIYVIQLNLQSFTSFFISISGKGQLEWDC